MEMREDTRYWGVALKKWSLLETAGTPDGGRMQLLEHDGDYWIRINGQELMSTRKHASEEALATLTCQEYSQKKHVRVLIGGLGLGYTLRTALTLLRRDAKIVVAEIVPEVIQWNHNPAYKFAMDPMSASRVEIVQQDVAHVIRSSPAGFDIILLDVDNGPHGLCVKQNDRLYQNHGLRMIRTALRPCGCLGIWGAQSNPEFARRLEKSGFDVEVRRAPSYQSSGFSHTLFLGRLGKPL